MSFSLRRVDIPDFGIPTARSRIPASTYAKRCQTAYERAGCDWLVVYADREHTANVTFLTGFDPRFEEALLLLGPDDRRVLVTGNECETYAALAGLPGLEVVLSQSMSLMGQDRSRRPDLAAVLREAGLAAGQRIGLVGWKYLEPEEWSGEASSFWVPAVVVDVLERIAGDPSAVVEATPVLMHPETGLRTIIDADQIALHEWGAARASHALWQIVTGIRAGDSELLAASRISHAGEPMNAHVMCTSNGADGPVIGLASPTARIIDRGDGAAAAVSYWGGLSARCGLVTDRDEEFLAVACNYYKGLLAWYEAAEIGAEGGEIFSRVAESLAEGGLEFTLNPGHLTGHDEWVHTPVRPGSRERIASGMPFQVDIIPAPMKNGWALNCEDGVVFADEALRAELQAKHPEVMSRVNARRSFIAEVLGVEVRPSILPLSSTPLCLPPFWLAPDMLLARE